MDSFFNTIKETAKQFSKLSKPIRVISHLDTDGLTSAAIMTKTLENLNKTFVLSIVRQLSPQILKELSKEEYENYIFLDLGSGNLEGLNNNLKNRNIFILDHHKPQEIETNFKQINPHLHGLDGSKEISGAGVTYLFSKALDEKNKSLAHLAILGAVGDTQDKDGFIGLNKLILDDAIAENKIEVKTGLRMFGSQTRPLYKVLKYSTDPYIPGITGDEAAAISLLEELNIDKDRKLIHLSEEELKKLVAAIIIQRMGSETEDPEDVLGNIYLMKDQEEESPLKDLKEFSTLLNSCGRMHKPSLGIGTCLGDKESYEEAIKLSHQYKTELIDSLNWFYKNKNSPSITETREVVIINAEDKVKDTLIGTITSMISKSNVYKPETIIISLAHTIEQNTKISIRLSGYNTPDVNLKEVLDNITQKMGYSSGGHNFAAGSLIPQEKEKEFINLVLETFKNQTETIILN